MGYREYNYRNDLGYYKTMIVYPKQNEKYRITIWTGDTGEYCGSGEITEEQLNEFLHHYKFISTND